MTRIEVFHFLEKIKAYYQNFSIEEYVINEWYDRLKKYDLNDVYKKLEQHLNGEYKNEIPKLHYITKYLKTPKEKSESNDYCFRCNQCNAILRMSNYDQHMSRHNSVDYMLKKSKQFNILIKFNEQQLNEISDENFNKFYDLFIEKLIEFEKDATSLQRLKNIIYSKAGIPVDEFNIQQQLKI